VSGAPVSEKQPRPLLRVVRGTPSDEELAALTAVLAAFPHGAADTRSPRGSTWAAPAARLRTPLHPGPGAWKASALPRHAYDMRNTV
jgi:hypothetical protein